MLRRRERELKTAALLVLVFFVCCLLGFLAVVLTLSGCASVPAPKPPTPSQAVVGFAIVPESNGQFVAGADVVLDGTHRQCCTNGVTEWQVLASVTTMDLTITADGYAPVHETFTVAPGIHRYSLQVALRRVHPVGREGWQDDTGHPWPWHNITSFRLAEYVAHGNPGAADTWLANAEATGSITINRVLSMAAIMWPLSPDEGVAALPALLDMAAAHGQHIEVVALADTKSYPAMDIEAHVTQIGAICATHPACVVEIANEPNHSSQQSRLNDPSYLAHLRTLIPADVPVSLGSSQDAIEPAGKFCVAGSNYCTVHSDRKEDEHGWRKVRHTKDAVQDTADALHLAIENDEPWRVDTDPDPAKQRALSWLEHAFRIGGTFHCASCLQSVWPTGAELDALNARLAGWADVPSDWHGVYSNAGFAGGPVSNANFNNVVRVYSSVVGNTGFTMTFGETGDPAIQWSWPNRQLLVDMGAAKLYAVNR